MKGAKRKLMGFSAVCRCGVVVGHCDYKRADRKRAGELLQQWLSSNYTIEPKFDSSRVSTTTNCFCEKK